MRAWYVVVIAISCLLLASAPSFATSGGGGSGGGGSTDDNGADDSGDDNGGGGGGGGGDDDGGGGGGGGGNNVDVLVRGNCTGSGDSKLKLGRENGNAVETEFELEHISANRRWRIQIRHNGTLVTNIVRISTVRGRIELNRLLADRAGADTIGVVAQRLPRGQRCTVSATAPANRT